MLNLIGMIAQALNEYNCMIGFNNDGTFFVLNSGLEKIVDDCNIEGLLKEVEGLAKESPRSSLDSEEIDKKYIEKAKLFLDLLK